jgi:23S rRNA (guanosine2251-2'-O)-methyltransferase
MTQQRPPGSKSGKPQGPHRSSGSTAQGRSGSPAQGRGAGSGERPKFGERRDGGAAKGENRFGGPKLSLARSGEARPQGERHQGERPQGRPERGPQERGQERGGQRDGQSRGQRAPAVPTGAVWLYGTHAVAAALANPARRLRRLVMTEEADAGLTAELPKPWPIQPEIATRDRIDQLLGARVGSGIVHQGVALLTDQLAAPALLDALKRPGPILVLDQISDPRNIGALMRTAQAFGAAMVIAQERNAPEETGALAKVASGALELIPLLRIVNISRALIVLKASNVWVVGLDGASENRLNGAAFAGRRVALVLGSEGEGMRRLTRETCDEIAALSMPGGMESLNVSAAGAVALYELTRG